METQEKKNNYKGYIVFGGIILIIIIAFVFLKPAKGIVDEPTAQCIGERSVLYVQLGCSHCIKQEEMFGDNYKYLNTIDCYRTPTLCVDAEITGTPTWIINGQKYPGVKSLEELKEATGC